MGRAAGQHLLSVYNKPAESTQNTNLLHPSYAEAGVFTTQKSYVKWGKRDSLAGEYTCPNLSSELPRLMFLFSSWRHLEEYKVEPQTPVWHKFWGS